jgi:hypothetical protein
MGANLIGELVANNGTYYLSGSGAIYSGNIDQIIVRGTGVIISAIYVTIDGEQIDVKTEYLSNTTLPDGLRITPKNNEVFTAVSLSGSSSSEVGLELVLA